MTVTRVSRAVALAPRPPLEHLGEAPDQEAFTPEYETWGIYDPGTGLGSGERQVTGSRTP